MKTLNTYINEWKLTDKTVSDIDKHTAKYHPKTYEELSHLVYERYQENPSYLNLTDIDVSNIKSFAEKNDYGEEWYGLFADFNVDIINISGWHTSHCYDMSETFWGCKYLEKIIGIEDLDISNVNDMSNMFDGCKSLKIDLNNWKPKSGCDLEEMFKGCKKEIIPSWYNKDEWE